MGSPRLWVENAVIDWDAIKTIWPISVILAGIGVRHEVDRALSKQRLAILEKRQSDDKGEIIARIDKLEKNTSKMFSEVRGDLKELMRK